MAKCLLMIVWFVLVPVSSGQATMLDLCPPHDQSCLELEDRSKCWDRSKEQRERINHQICLPQSSTDTTNLISGCKYGSSNFSMSELLKDHPDVCRRSFNDCVSQPEDHWPLMNYTLIHVSKARFNVSINWRLPSGVNVSGYSLLISLHPWIHPLCMNREKVYLQCGVTTLSMDATGFMYSHIKGYHKSKYEESFYIKLIPTGWCDGPQLRVQVPESCHNVCPGACDLCAPYDRNNVTPPNKLTLSLCRSPVTGMGVASVAWQPGETYYRPYVNQTFYLAVYNSSNDGVSRHIEVVGRTSVILYNLSLNFSHNYHIKVWSYDCQCGVHPSHVDMVMDGDTLICQSVRTSSTITAVVKVTNTIHSTSVHPSSTTHSTSVYPSPSKSTSLNPSPSNSTSLYPSPSKSTSLNPSPSKSTSLYPSPSKSTSLNPSPSNSTSLNPSPSNSNSLNPSPSNSTSLYPSPSNSNSLNPSPSNSLIVHPTTHSASVGNSPNVIHTTASISLTPTPTPLFISSSSAALYLFLPTLLLFVTVLLLVIMCCVYHRSHDVIKPQSPDEVTLTPSKVIYKRVNVLVVYSLNTPTDDIEVILENFVKPLNNYGVNVTFYDMSYGRGGIPQWMEVAVMQSSKVFMVCNKDFKREWDSPTLGPMEGNIVHVLKQIFFAQVNQCSDYTSKFALLFLTTNCPDSYIASSYFHNLKRFLINPTDPSHIEQTVRFIYNCKTYSLPIEE